MARLAADPVRVLPEQRDILEQLMRDLFDVTAVGLAGAHDPAGRRWCGCACGRSEARGLAEDGAVSAQALARGNGGATGRRAAGGCATIRVAPATFTAEQICAVVAMTCERPEDSDRPISQWSQREIADEAMRRGIIPQVSQRSVGRFLKRSRPSTASARLRHWLTPKPDPAFDAKCADICEVYKAAAGSDQTHRTVSIDEMTGIQALERIAPGLPMAPGKVERREFEYRRHGTQTLIAAFDVSTGRSKALSATPGPRRFRTISPAAC